MALVQNPVFSNDAKMIKTAQGINLFLAGPSFIQHSPSPDLANSAVETSVFGAPGTQVNFGPDFPFVKSALGFPPNSLTLGSIWEVRLFATLSFALTPNLVFKAYLNDPSTPLALNGVSIMNGATGTNSLNFLATTGPVNAEVLLRFIVTGVGITGSIASMAKVIYSIGGNASDTVINTLYASVPVNTTHPYALNVTAKWSAANALNVFSLKSGTVSLVG